MVERRARIGKETYEEIAGATIVGISENIDAFGSAGGQGRISALAVTEFSCGSGKGGFSNAARYSVAVHACRFSACPVFKATGRKVGVALG